MAQLAPRFVPRVPRFEYDRGAVEFVLSSPVAGVPDVVLSTGDDELTLDFALSHWHVTYQGERVSAQESVQKALEIVSEIESERRIAVEGREGRSGRRKFWGLVPLAEYQELRDAGRLRKAVSWLGNHSLS